MMIKPFRKYSYTADWISEHGIRETCKGTINLYDVFEWCETERSKFNDGTMRTSVVMCNGVSFIMRMSLKKFDQMMTQFLSEVGLLDDRSMRRPVPPAKYTYIGPIKYAFAVDNAKVACTAFPKTLNIKSLDDAVSGCLFSNVTPMN